MINYATGNYADRNNAFDTLIIQSLILGWWDYIAGVGTAVDLSTGTPRIVDDNSF